MGVHSQPDPLSRIENSLSSVDLNGLGIGTRRRSGWLAALLKAGPESSPQPWDEKLPGSQIRSDGRPPLVRAMNQGESGQPDPGISTPESTYSANGQARMADSVQNHRIEDDKSRSPYGDVQAMTPVAQSSTDRPAGDFTEQAPAMARAARASLIDQVRQPQQPEADPYAPLNQHIKQMQTEYDQLNQPAPPQKHKLLHAIGNFVAGFGNPQYAQGLRQEREFGENQKRERQGRLLQEMTADERTLASEQNADKRERDLAERANLGKTVTLGDKMMQWNPKTQAYDTDLGYASVLKPEVHDTDQGPIQYDPKSGQWTPIQVGGQRVGAKPTKPDSPEQQYIDAASSGDKATANRLLQNARTWSAATQKPERSDVAAQRAGVRGDRSYQFQSSRIDKLATPIEQRAERISRLEDTLAQGNPQADALVAPELLTIMAGGQGSGLRMNEAEIARMVGGRSAWENLKANIQHWSTDPQAARSITPDQQKQIRALFGAIKQRVASKAQIIDREREALAATDDPMEHRRIFNRLAKGLQDADTDAASGEQSGGQSGRGKTLSMSAIQQAAKDHGVSVDEAKRQAQAAGYSIQ